MRLRSAASVLCLCCLGADPIASVPAPPSSAAQRLWEQGQKAILGGDTDGAIAAYRESLRLDPGMARNHLSLAAAFMEKGEEGPAADQMADYLRGQPDHFIVRLHYAELLLRLGRPREAQDQFERFIADAQTRPALAEEHLVHCHSKLMEIAQSKEDDYGEHLHRGIGLYLLAKQRAALPDPSGELSVEGLLCKAAGELALATRGRPDEARPCWYLSVVWRELAQRRPATRWLHAAEGAAPFTYLTPGEREGLRMACRQCEAEAPQR
jgi:tetratricopeptide (TPR) repeat protein